MATRPALLPPSASFEEYCWYDAARAHRILDEVLDPHEPLPETLRKHLNTIRSYVTGSRPFDDLCPDRQGVAHLITSSTRAYHTTDVCGRGWTTPMINYHCRTCAIQPSMNAALSLCAECFHAGDHGEHDTCVLQSVSGGVCDCGDVTVMNANGFCNHHGPHRIPSEPMPPKRLQCIRIVVMRLLVYSRIDFSVAPIDDNDTRPQCCICHNENQDSSPLGLIVRFDHSEVLDSRRVTLPANDYLPSSNKNAEHHSPESEDPLGCCDPPTRSNDQAKAPVDVIGRKKSRLTYAQFYDERRRTMLKIFSKESVSASTTKGVTITSCGHSMHASCYRQCTQSQRARSTIIDIAYEEFKCPACNQRSNALLAIPEEKEPTELHEYSVETIARLIETTADTLVFADYDEWCTALVQKVSQRVDPSPLRLKRQGKLVADDDDLASLLVSTLRSQLEQDLLVRTTRLSRTLLSQRKRCFRELLYTCRLAYPDQLREPLVSLWQRITDIHGMNHASIDSLPLLLMDPVALLLRLQLALPHPMRKDSFQIIVQAVSNVAYVHALFSFISEMSENEQRIWSSTGTSKDKERIYQYLRIVSAKLSQAQFYSTSGQGTIHSIEAMRSAIRERCGHFLQIVALIQHHLFKPITWWLPGRPVRFELLWGNLVKEVRLDRHGEPSWFCDNPTLLITHWLDEALAANQRHSIRSIVRTTAKIHSPRLIDLPTSYCELLRSYAHSKCSFCRKRLVEPMLCLLCGDVYLHRLCEQPCCVQQAAATAEHSQTCGGGLILWIDINSTRTVIQQKERYACWVSLYLDQHGEEDPDLRRGGALHLERDRLDLLYSAWVTSAVSELIDRTESFKHDLHTSLFKTSTKQQNIAVAHKISARMPSTSMGDTTKEK